MSYAKKSYAKKSSTKNPIVQRLCGFCRKAGRIHEAQEHSLKDKHGNVSCPFLAKIKCSYCEQAGHTTSHCANKIKSEKFRHERELQRYMAAKAQKKPHQDPVQEKEVKKPTNVFACLYESDADSPRTPSSDRPTCCSPRPLVKKVQAIRLALAPLDPHDPYPFVGVTNFIAIRYDCDERVPSDSESDSDSDSDDADPYYDMEAAAVDWVERWR